MQDSPWNEMTGQKDEENFTPSTETLEDSVKRMVDEISKELAKTHEHKYDEKQAVKTAALALKAQMALSEFLSDSEATAKGAKNAVKIVEAEAYFEHRNSAEKKISEAALQQLVARDKKVQIAEQNVIEAERKSKKWAIVFAILKDAHIFFRNLGKNDWSM